MEVLMRFTCRNESREYTLDVDYFVTDETIYPSYGKPVRTKNEKDRIFKQMATVFHNTQVKAWNDVADWLFKLYEMELGTAHEDSEYMRLKDSMPIRCEMVKELERIGEDPSDERLLDSLYKVRYQTWENQWKANGTRERIERLVRLMNLWEEGRDRKLSSVTGMYMPQSKRNPKGLPSLPNT